jgi:hypothetical protein
MGVGAQPSWVPRSTQATFFMALAYYARVIDHPAHMIQYVLVSVTLYILINNIELFFVSDTL